MNFIILKTVLNSSEVKTAGLIFRIYSDTVGQTAMMWDKRWLRHGNSNVLASSTSLNVPDIALYVLIYVLALGVTTYIVFHKNINLTKWQVHDGRQVARGTSDGWRWVELTAVQSRYSMQLLGTRLYFAQWVCLAQPQRLRSFCQYSRTCFRNLSTNRQ